MQTRAFSVPAFHLAVLTVFTLAKGAFWIALLPPFLVADEPAHFDNITFRAETGAAPTYTGKGEPLARVVQPGASEELRLLWESTLPKSYYRTTHVRKPGDLLEKLDLLALRPDGRKTDGQDPAMNYPGGYYRLAVPIYKRFQTSNIITRILAIRVLSLAFGLCAVLCTYLAALRVIDDPSVALAAAFLVAVQPMESQQTAAVNNDAGVIGFGALVFYFQVRALSTLPKLPGLGTIAGLLVSTVLLVDTKPNGYGLLPGLGVVGLAIVYTFRKARWMRWALPAAVALGGLAALHLARTGFDLRAMIPGNTDEPGPYGHRDFVSFLDSLEPHYLDYLLRSAWGQFGWLDYSIHGYWIARLRLAFQVVAIATLVTTAAYALRDPDRPYWLRGRLWGFCIGTAVAGVAFILFVEHRFRLTWVMGVIQGRNFLYVLPAFAIWVAVALAGSVPRRMRTVSMAILCSGALFFHFAGVFTILRQHYVR